MLPSLDSSFRQLFFISCGNECPHLLRVGGHLAVGSGSEFQAACWSLGGVQESQLSAVGADAPTFTPREALLLQKHAGHRVRLLLPRWHRLGQYPRPSCSLRIGESADAPETGIKSMFMHQAQRQRVPELLSIRNQTLWYGLPPRAVID